MFPITNWQAPFEVAPPPEDDGDLSQLPSQMPSQVWTDVSSEWPPGVPKLAGFHVGPASGHPQVVSRDHCNHPQGYQLQSHQTQGYQTQGHQTQGQPQGHQTQGYQFQGHQLQGHQTQGQPQGHQTQGQQQGHQTQGQQGHQTHEPQAPGHQPPSHYSSRHPQTATQQAPYLESEVEGQAPVDSTSTGMLIPVSEIPEQYRSIFSQFPYFNIVQSTVFSDVFCSERSVVVSAPTGSGKTVVMELALVKLKLSRAQHPDHDSPPPRVVYMAPMKALVSERYLGWKRRLGPLGITCAEVTGDTEHDDISVIRNSQVVLTTPEKWDSLTRRWRDHASLMQAVSLLLIDEVHVLSDEGRGPTLEAVVSRMKTIRATRPPTHPNQCSPALRFIAVSATIPNAEDVAAWLSDDQGPAIYHKLEESLRPVALRRVVLGYDSRESWTDFRFDISLTYRLPSVIATYSNNKPTLVFVSTRKSAQTTATALTREARLVRDAGHRQLLTATGNSLRDNKLRESVLCGVGYHHAGLDTTDRHQIEELFVAGQLPVLIATSTLAIGVNLPAHLVVIKSTAQYVSGAYQEYSVAQLLQMTGRAGRPQYDTHATAVIMTKHQHKVKYENLLTGRSLLESHLHLHLVEHLNAEIVLGTVTDLAVAVEWLRSTFLYVRVQHNPRHYRLPLNLTHSQLEAKLQEMCTREVNALSQAGLILQSEIDVKPTTPGRLMARYCVSFITMKTFIQLKGDESLKELVEMVSGCREFWDIKVRMSEKRVLNEINKSQTTSIRFPIKGKIKTREHKINCLIQATLGSQTITDPGLNQENTKIMRTGQRVTKCLAEYGATRKDYELQLNTTLLCKCFSSRLWENSRYVTRQLERIGPALSASFVRSKITSFSALEACSPRDIELILNRQPPFGNRIRDQAVRLPRYELTLQQLNQVSVEHSEVRVTVRVANYQELMSGRGGATTPKHHSCRLILGDADNNLVYNQRLTDPGLMVTGTATRLAKVSRAQAGDELAINFISETWAGLDVQSCYTPRYLPRPAVSILPAAPVTSASHHPNDADDECEVGDGHSSEGGRRACYHTCGDKHSCAHKCCKVGVSARGESSSSSSLGLSVAVKEIRKKASQLPETPVKKIKMTESGGTTCLSKFKYTPHPRLLPAPHPAKPSTTLTAARNVLQPITNTNETHTRNRYVTQPMFSDYQPQQDDLINEDVLKEFKNAGEFQENDYQDVFPDMEVFTTAIGKENSAWGYEAAAKNYDDAFTEPLGVEDLDQSSQCVTETSWENYQFRQQCSSNRGDQQLRQQNATVSNFEQEAQSSAMLKGASAMQRLPCPANTQSFQTQRPIQSSGGNKNCSQPSGSRANQTQRHILPPTRQTNQNQRPIQPMAPQVNRNQRPLRPPAPHTNQNQKPLRPPAQLTNQKQSPLRPPAPQTNQNQRPIRPMAPLVNQTQRHLRPPGPQTNQNQRPLRPPGPQANQNQRPLRPPAPQTNQNQRPIRLPAPLANQNQMPLRPPAPQINQNQRPLRPLYLQASQMQNTQDVQVGQVQEPLGQSQRPVRPSIRQTDQGAWPWPAYAQMPLGPQSIQTYQRTLQPSGIQSTPITRPVHSLSTLNNQTFQDKISNHSHPPRGVLNNQYPVASNAFSNESLQTEDHMEYQLAEPKHQVPPPLLPSHVQRPPVYQTHNPPRTVTSMLPTTMATFQQPENSQAMLNSSHPQQAAENDVLYQNLHPSQTSSANDRYQSSLDNQMGPAHYERLDYSQQIPGDSVNQGWNTLHGHSQINPSTLSTNQQPQGCGSYLTSSLQHVKPVVGIKPLPSTSGQWNKAKQKKTGDPFSHLTKEWRESQRGRSRCKLSNISLSTPQNIQGSVEGLPTTREINNSEDDWQDLKMFQWCRQQEKLSLESLYQKGQQLSNDPQSGSTVEYPVPTGSTQGGLHITYGGGNQGPAVGVTSMGGIQQNININLSGILGPTGGTRAAPSTHPLHATTSQPHDGEPTQVPQVRGILKKPSQRMLSVPLDIFEGIL